MKTRTKLLTAVLSTVTALSCALTAAAAPAITLQGNEAKPADGTKSGTADLRLQATGFAEVAGADLEFTLPSGVMLTGVTIKSNDTGANWTPSNEGNNQNYTLKNGNTVKIVDIFSMGDTTVDTLDLTVTISFNAAEIGNYTFDNNVRLVKADESDIEDVKITTGDFVIGKKAETATGSESAQLFDNEKSFVPYGILKDESEKYITKDENGAFTFSNSQPITRFKLPVEHAVTTFGASYDPNFEKSETVQFGSYIHSIAAEAKSFGTVLIYSKDLTGAVAGYKKGSYEGAVEYFGSADELFENIITTFKEKNRIDSKFHPYAYGGNGNTNDSVIYACVVVQKNYMWRHYTDATRTTLDRLQYAVRCKTKTLDRDFTAVGYIENTDKTYSFSTEIKTESYNSLSKAQ